MQTEIQIEDPDGIYEMLVGLHAGLDSAESAKVNAKLVLLMANQIGDDAILRDILDYVRSNIGD